MCGYIGTLAMTQLIYDFSHFRFFHSTVSKSALQMIIRNSSDFNRLTREVAIEELICLVRGLVIGIETSYTKK